MSKRASSPERILERAIEVLETSGEAGIRTHQVAEDCGVTAPILYRAFGDREGLIIAAQAERYNRSMRFGQDELTANITKCVSKEEFRRLMEALSDARATSVRANDRRVRAEVLGASSSRPVLRQKVAEINARLADEIAAVFRLAVDKGWMRDDFDLRTGVVWWLGMIGGRTLIELPEADFDEESWARMAKESFMKVLFGE